MMRAQILKLFVGKCELCVEDAAFDDQFCTKDDERRFELVVAAGTRSSAIDRKSVHLTWLYCMMQMAFSMTTV